MWQEIYWNKNSLRKIRKTSRCTYFSYVTRFLVGMSRIPTREHLIKLKGTVRVFFQVTIHTKLVGNASIHNNTFETWIWSKRWKNVDFLTRKRFLWISPYCNSQPQGKLNSFQNQKHGVPIQTWSEKAFKGKPLNRVLQVLYVGSLEILLLQSL